MVARAGEAIVFPQDVSQGYRTRATMKALPTAPHHPRPYGLPALLPAFPTEVDAYWLTARVNPTIHAPARYTPDAVDAPCIVGLTLAVNLAVLGLGGARSYECDDLFTF